MSVVTDLDGRVAIVSGGGARGDDIGNGRAAALLLARAGAHVAVVDRVGDLAERTATMIETEGGSAVWFEADATEPNDCERVIAKTVARFGRIDMLDNNVGVGSSGSVLDEDPERWDRVLRINVNSVYNMSRFAIPEMIKNGGGSIINVSSISAMRPTGRTAYSTSKGAVITLTEAMAVDHGADGVRVNCVAPGPVYTPMVNQDMSDEMRDRRRRASLLQIEGTGWDVGNAVLFLASDAARYITGHTLVVDGGVTLTGPRR